MLLSINDAAAELSVSRWTVRRLIDSGALPVVKLPIGRNDVRRLLIDRADIERLVANSKELEG